MHQWKLVELKARTDRDVIRNLQRDLDRGLALASVASDTESPLYARAEEAYRRAAALVRFIPTDTSDLRRLLDELRIALDRVPRATMLTVGV